MVTFWGPTYRQYFVDRCLASLLAPGNLPQLRAEDGHRLLIATTPADWQAIELLPIMQAVRRYVTPIHLDIDPPGPTPPGSEAAILQQNRCHKLLLETAYSYRTYACMLWPDIIFSDGLGLRCCVGRLKASNSYCSRHCAMSRKPCLTNWRHEACYRGMRARR